MWGLLTAAGHRAAAAACMAFRRKKFIISSKRVSGYAA
jgi:hypothetical protein